eukprot:1211870-Rhodomonas_salina.1
MRRKRGLRPRESEQEFLFFPLAGPFFQPLQVHSPPPSPSRGPGRAGPSEFKLCHWKLSPPPPPPQELEHRPPPQSSAAASSGSSPRGLRVTGSPGPATVTVTGRGTGTPRLPGRA